MGSFQKLPLKFLTIPLNIVEVLKIILTSLDTQTLKEGKKLNEYHKTTLSYKI